MDAVKLDELATRVAATDGSRDVATALVATLGPAERVALVELVRSDDQRVRDAAMTCVYILAAQGDAAIEAALGTLKDDDDPTLVRKAERALRALARAQLSDV